MDTLNSLNSVLIEGTLTADPNMRMTPHGLKETIFHIETTRTHISGDLVSHEYHHFDIIARKKLGKSCFENLRLGRGVRVVGYLIQEHLVLDDGSPHSLTRIVAEHVEFKPLLTKEPSEDTSSSED